MKTWRSDRILLIAFFLVFTAFQQDKFLALRNGMVKEQIEERGISNSPTLRAMRKVPRHQFVPEEMVPYAYEDRPLPIGLGQTISQPYIVAYMTSVIDPLPYHKVLEIGTGSGYQAAVLAEIVDTVYTIEILPKLAELASETLRTLGYSNVINKTGDGFKGWPEHAPYDAIIVTAAPEAIPPPLFEQLKEGGRMIIPVGTPYSIQNLLLITKKKGKAVTETKFPVRFVPFTRE